MSSPVVAVDPTDSSSDCSSMLTDRSNCLLIPSLVTVMPALVSTESDTLGVVNVSIDRGGLDGEADRDGDGVKQGVDSLSSRRAKSNCSSAVGVAAFESELWRRGQVSG